MIAFVGFVLGFCALLLAFAAPVIWVAYRRGKRDTIRRFVVAALICGVLCGTITSGGRRLEQQCRDQGNPNCNDFGGNGMRLMILTGFLGTSLVKTRMITRR